MIDRHAPTKLFKRDEVLVGSFSRMNCSCEILMDTDDLRLAQELLDIACRESQRIEEKFSRYRTDNIVHTINTSDGRPVEVDEETAHLLDFADRAFTLSEGLFDVTSGVLRKAWRFDGSENFPAEDAIRTCLPLVGWDKVQWNRPVLQLKPGMEIDLGGIGKEYAVDRVLTLLREKADIGILVNFGGDVAVSGERRGGKGWAVGIENAERVNNAVRIVHLKKGALATSGDSKKFLMKDGRRYGHILNPRNGWPVENAPQSVTIATPTCSKAGFLSTFGILNGPNAKPVLDEAGVANWCY